MWCLRHLEIIGEAASRLSEEFRLQHRGIPWREIIGMRNVLIHGYFDVDWQQVWVASGRDVPNLLRELRSIRLPDDLQADDR